MTNWRDLWPQNIMEGTWLLFDLELGNVYINFPRIMEANIWYLQTTFRYKQAYGWKFIKPYSLAGKLSQYVDLLMWPVIPEYHGGQYICIYQPSLVTNRCMVGKLSTLIESCRYTFTDSRMSWRPSRASTNQVWLQTGILLECYQPFYSLSDKLSHLTSLKFWPFNYMHLCDTYSRISWRPI